MEKLYGEFIMCIINIVRIPLYFVFVTHPLRCTIKTCFCHGIIAYKKC